MLSNVKREQLLKALDSGGSLRAIAKAVRVSITTVIKYRSDGGARKSGYVPGGRMSIFGSKKGGMRIQGEISREAIVPFKAARSRLAKLAKVEADTVSQADTVEFLSRGEKETRAVLKSKATK